MNTLALDNEIETPHERVEKPVRPVDGSGHPIYRVPEVNLDTLRARVEKMNKRARKLGMEPLILTEIGEEFEERTRRRRTDEDGGPVVKFTIRIVLVSLIGNCPRVNGWAMAATIQHEEGGNILRTVPGFDTLLPMRYRTAGTACEHCNQARQRNDTYVLQGVDGAWKQVGRNCLADFLRTENANGLAEWAEFLAGLDEEMSGFEDADGWDSEGGERRGEYFTALRLLTQVACCVRADGWCSRTEAKNADGKQATVDTALACLDLKWFDKQRADFRESHTATEADEVKAAAAIAWAQALAVDVANDYLWNIRVVSHKEYIGGREAGLAGSIIAAYNRHLEQEMKRKYELDNPSDWFGTVGERGVFVLTVIGTREMESDYGLTTLVTFRDQAGNRAKWFASGSTELKVDETYTVKATVKAHEEYKGSKQTGLSRVAVYDAAAEAQQKANAKVIKKVLKAYKCGHEMASVYGVRQGWQYFHVASLDQYAADGHWQEACCDACFEAWTGKGGECMSHSGPDACKCLDFRQTGTCGHQTPNMESSQ